MSPFLYTHISYISCYLRTLLFKNAKRGEKRKERKRRSHATLMLFQTRPLGVALAKHSRRSMSRFYPHFRVVSLKKMWEEVDRWCKVCSTYLIFSRARPCVCVCLIYRAKMIIINNCKRHESLWSSQGQCGRASYFCFIIYKSQEAG